MAYTTLNIILVIIAIVAPFVANALVANAPAGKDFVVPFVAGAMANVAAMNAINVKAAQPTAEVSKTLVSSAGAGIRGVANRLSDSFRSAPSAAVASEAAPATNNATSPKQASDPGARQARRGAIINQNKNKAPV